MTGTWDVIVVGAGPAGSTCARQFALQGRRVLLVDAARFPRRKACAEYVSPGGAAILERLGVTARLDAAHASRWLRGMRIQAPAGDYHLVEYVDSASGTARRGLSVARSVLDSALLDVAQSCGAQVKQNFRVRDVWRDHGRVFGVVGPAGERLAAELVVGADGVNSIVTRSLGARRGVVWPRRLGLVAHWEGVPWPEDYGQLIVGRHGYVGIAPIDDAGHVSVGLVRSMPAGRLGSATAAFEAGLAHYPSIRERLDRGRLVGPVLGVGPLARRVVGPAGPGYALVGDAAGFFDPFTGEGIFRALHGAELLTDSPSTYAQTRKRAFAVKERLVALIQILVQNPRLMDFAVHRLQRRPRVACELGNVLGDLQPAHPGLAWHLLGP